VVCFWGRSSEDAGVPHQRHDQSQGLVYIKAGLAERPKSPDLNVPALALGVAERFPMLTLPGKP